jgi:hypothetical protein
MKTCSKCGSNYTGLTPYCNQCTVKYNRDWTHRTGRKCPITEAKDCSSYLGDLAERALLNYFDHVKRMPINNPRYDFICSKGYKIDVKSSCLAQHGKTYRWAFSLKYNDEADYFFCLGFDDRKSLTPIHIWLIPNENLTCRKNLSITDTPESLSRFTKYEYSLDRIQLFCSNVRREVEA